MYIFSNKNSFSSSLSYGETSVNANATAIENGYLEMYGLSLDYGNYFSVTDDVTGAQKVILGKFLIVENANSYFLQFKSYFRNYKINSENTKAIT